jgi:adenine-specific DNA-methyltransferase
MAKSKNGKLKASREASTYRHPEADSPLRPEVGTQPQFKKRKPPVTYRYDSSLSPELNWDGQNHAREAGEALIREILEANSLEGAKGAAERLKAMSGPFLNWAGKAERLSFDVPTLPLFVHERLSTKGIIETLKGHKLDPQLGLNLFGDPGRSITDQVLKAYEYRDEWVNRMILGDSLVVMNSLLHYEGLGGQVLMIYIDPPYGVRFGSNFQPFVRKRDVTHNDDEDMTREPEMVKAYRDTWELGLHSYFTYLRDRLLLARELLTPTGSLFVQISDENLHHVREILDGIFGGTNFAGLIAFAKTTGFSGKRLSSVADYILWYARDIERMKYCQLYRQKEAGDEGATKYRPVDTIEAIPKGRFVPVRLATSDQLTSQGASEQSDQRFHFAGRTWIPPTGLHWKTTVDGLKRLGELGRIVIEGNSLRFVRFLDDFPVFPISNIWNDVGGIQNRSEGKLYVVQTANLAIERCLLMTTDPGDLVVDPTCGSGTTAYVAEQWGRRWITIDTSRVPLALARQRLLTATFPYYQLKDEARGPAGGFVYQRKQNQKGEQVGGIVPHVTLKSIANDEPADEEVLVDRPEPNNNIIRVAGPFCVEATIPTPADYEAATTSQNDGTDDYGSFIDRMLEVLRKSPVLQVGGGKKVTLRNVRPPAKTLSLSAEAMVANGADKSVAFVFGPENGAVSEKVVHDAAFEAHGKSYSHLYVIGFAIQPNARNLIDNCEAVMNIPTTYVQATPDLMMGDLLKTMRSSQIFSVCGLPEVKLRQINAKGNGATQYQAELTGLDVFDPIEMRVHHDPGDNVPAWFLDTDYNGLCFHVSQAFFPRTSAWDSLRKALRGTYDERYGTISRERPALRSRPASTGRSRSK